MKTSLTVDDFRIDRPEGKPKASEWFERPEEGLRAALLHEETGEFFVCGANVRAKHFFSKGVSTYDEALQEVASILGCEV